jgi:hypothetical protein
LKALGTACFAVALVAGCAGGGNAGEVPLEVLAHQATLPLSEARESIAVAATDADLQRQWERFRFRGSVPEVDFDQSLAIVAGTGESSVCPLTPPVARLSEEPGVLILESGTTGGPDCTDDFNPRAFLLAVPRDRLPDGGISVEWRRPREG